MATRTKSKPRKGQARKRTRPVAASTVEAPSEPSHTLTPEKEGALAAFITTGTVRGAMQTVGMARRTWYDWKDNDPTFRAAAEAVTDDVADDLEQEAVKRAKAGSDVLLIFLLKAHRPEKYREKVEHTGKNGKPIQHEHATKQTWLVGDRKVAWN